MRHKHQSIEPEGNGSSKNRVLGYVTENSGTKPASPRMALVAGSITHNHTVGEGQGRGGVILGHCERPMPCFTDSVSGNVILHRKGEQAM